jgi:hypothetical protein
VKKWVQSVAFKHAVKRSPAYFDDAEWENAGHVILYEQVRCAYNRIKKSANSSVLMFMADALQASGAEGHSADYERYKKQSVRLGRPLKKVWRARQLEPLQDYFWFTVVRNPYTRLLSSFLQKGTVENQSKERYRKILGFGDLTPGGFNEFVSFLEDGGLHENGHWWPQHELLFFPYDRFDYIAKTETLDEDMRHIFSVVGLNKTPASSFSRPHSAESATGWKVTNANDRVKMFYNPKLFERVYNLYKNDFLFFGYDPA